MLVAECSTTNTAGKEAVQKVNSMMSWIEHYFDDSTDAGAAKEECLDNYPCECPGTVSKYGGPDSEWCKDARPSGMCLKSCGYCKAAKEECLDNYPCECPDTVSKYGGPDSEWCKDAR